MANSKKGKVRNATKVDKYGIHFRSKLELYTYEAFMNAGIPVLYEPKHFTLLEKFEYNGEKIRPITYLPDFIGKYNGMRFIVECKGLMGDSFPLRYKLFFSHQNKQTYLNYSIQKPLSQHKPLLYNYTHYHPVKDE